MGVQIEGGLDGEATVEKDQVQIQGTSVIESVIIVKRMGIFNINVKNWRMTWRCWENQKGKKN